MRIRATITPIGTTIPKNSSIVIFLSYKYTNTVTLPFKVSNANTTVWHNIYWPSNTRESDYPVYLSASTADDYYVPKVTGSYAYGDHPTYNTLDGNENISWAIYNVNNGFEFIFKNKVTDKYIQVTSVADNNAQHVKARLRLTHRIPLVSLFGGSPPSMTICST